MHAFVHASSLSLHGCHERAGHAIDSHAARAELWVTSRLLCPTAVGCQHARQAPRRPSVARHRRLSVDPVEHSCPRGLLWVWLITGTAVILPPSQSWTPDRPRHSRPPAAQRLSGRYPAASSGRPSRRRPQSTQPDWGTPRAMGPARGPTQARILSLIGSLIKGDMVS
jgi:hypothetical protein